MRIISGSHKGRKLRAPKNLPVRPTTELQKKHYLIFSQINMNGQKSKHSIFFQAPEILVMSLPPEVAKI